MPSGGTTGGGGGGLGGVVLTGTAANGKVVEATGANAAQWLYPPGFEIGYAQITANANITDTAQSTATQLIPGGPYTFDGGAVIATFFTPAVSMDTGAVSDVVVISLFEGATQIGVLARIRSVTTTTPNNLPVLAQYRFTPTAGAHTYKLTASVTSTTGTPFIAASSGGTGAFLPAFLRFTKV